MGIVVTVAMFLGLCLLVPQALGLPSPSIFQRWSKQILLALLILGCWNVGWYGFRHLATFWGIAALVSGALMAATSLYGLKQYGHASWPLIAFFVPLHRVWLLGLGTCFILYTIALVRLNLGLPV